MNNKRDQGGKATKKTLTQPPDESANDNELVVLQQTTVDDRK